MKSKYDKVLESIDKIMELNKKQNEIYNKMKLALVMEKEFNTKKNGGKFLIVNKAYHRRSFNMMDRGSIYDVRSYNRIKDKSKIQDCENTTLIYDIKNNKHIEVENLVLEKERFVMRCHKK